MDVFALSSLREGLPNVLLEAMALEVPAVATRIAGIPRLIQDGRNGLLIDPGDQAALDRSLYALLTNPGMRELFRAAARRTIETRYSFPIRMQRLKRIYDELLGA
jgi:glycosyltransferase involved in cell wall biosynthesis